MNSFGIIILLTFTNEHVMRIGSDVYEVFGSKASNDRMKAIWMQRLT